MKLKMVSSGEVVANAPVKIATCLGFNNAFKLRERQIDTRNDTYQVFIDHAHSTSNK